MTRNKLENMISAIRDGKLIQAAGGIKSELTLSDKLGFDRLNIYVNDVLVRQEYVEQEIKVGTEDNPIVWKEGAALIPNAYYVSGDEAKVWMGETGTVADWTDDMLVPI